MAFARRDCENQQETSVRIVVDPNMSEHQRQLALSAKFNGIVNATDI